MLSTAAAVLSASSPSRALAADPVQRNSVKNHSKMTEARSWTAAKFEGNEPFFSFTYDGKPSAEELKTWKSKKATRQLDENRTEHLLLYTEPKTGLELRCVGVEYRDFPTVEWTLYFKNTGDKDTPILSDIQALDIQLERPPLKKFEDTDKEFRLHHYVGGEFSAEAYRPLETTLRPGTTKTITATNGRPSDKDMPYFNLQHPGDAGGLIVVVGWPGQWAAQFTRNIGTDLRISAGQELTHLKLLPGEEIRTPLIVLQFWEGDRIRSQNIWRQWMSAHNVPRPGGKLPPPQLAAYSGTQFNEMVNANTENQNLFIDRYREEGIKLDYWWMDAGWYPCDGDWWKTGTWEVDTKRFPKGLREISDYAHAQGVKTIVWFEPERVEAGTWLANNHPEWILVDGKEPSNLEDPVGYLEWQRGGEKGCGVLNLGNPDAWTWLVNHIDKLIVEQGIDLYRQDFNINMGTLLRWRANDAADRQGITENKHVVGYLAYFDELIRRHPDMLLDTCASGGRRNDLETLRRAVPLHRNDYDHGAVSQQCHTYGITFWIPYHGRMINVGNDYEFRSRMFPSINSALDMRSKELNYAGFRHLLEQWRQVAPCYFGDYYPLTSYSLEKNVWMAWQFDRPDLGEGMVQVFRREESPFETASFKLHGLAPDVRYTVKDMDKEGSVEMMGHELMEKGLHVALSNSPQAAIFTYKQTEATN